MKPIETGYKGYKFRSRLEARWAVFFDACGVKWEYEPEGFDLGDGLYYLPDFLLHDVFFRNDDTPYDLWVEVKGQMTEADAQKIFKFAFEENVFGVDDIRRKFLGIGNPILILTNVPDDPLWDIDVSMFPYPFSFSLIDGDDFGAIPVINKQGRLVIMDANGRCVGEHDEEATKKAYMLARQARFEHGQKGRA